MAIADILNLKLDNQGDLELETVSQQKTVFVPSVLTSLEQDVVLYLKMAETAGNVGSELVVNQGFETYTTSPGAPDNWTKDTNITAEKETVIRRSGSNSLKLTATGSTVTTDGVSQTLVGLVAGKAYQASAFMRTSGGINEQGRVVVLNTTDSVTVLDLRSPIGSAATAFLESSGTFVAVAGKTYVVECRLLNAAGTTPPSGAIAYFDDISVKQVETKDSTLNAFHGTPKAATNTAGPTLNGRGPLEPASALVSLYPRNPAEPDEVRFYKASIAGFNITVADPVAAGWTRITGMTDMGQSGTHLVVITNGHARIALDKTTSNGVLSVRLAFWNGSQYQYAAENETGSSHDWQDLTVTRVATNTANMVQLVATGINRNAGSSTVAFAVMKGLPTVRIRTMTAAAPSANGSLALRSTVERLVLVNPSGSIPEGRDVFGFTGSNNTSLASWYSIPLVGFGLDLLVQRSTDLGSDVFTASTAIVAFGRHDSAVNTVHLSGIPRSFGLGDANQFYGHNDGQLREAEGHRVWEGETPLIGTELLTNGQFETDLTGWTQSAGTWTRITTQKKFGTASVQVALTGAAKTLTSTVSGLTVGATYAVTGWIRTTAAVGTGAASFQVNGISGALSAVIASGQEWTYATALFVATATSHVVQLQANSLLTSGTAEFDGISVVQVKDASGVSTLAFDTCSLTGWTQSSITSASVVDTPRGKGFRFTPSANFGHIRFEFSARHDISRFTNMGFWARIVSGSGQVNTALRQPSNNSTGQTGLAPGGFTTDWKYFKCPINPGDAAATNFGTIYIEGSVAGSTYEIGPFYLSEFDSSIGARHGLVDPLEDPDLIAWHKLDETTGTDGANLVANPGFETYTTTPGVPDSWAVYNGGASTNFAKETTIIRSGSNAVKHTVPAGGSLGLAQTITVTAGKSYYVEAWGRTGGQATAQCGMAILNNTDTVNVTPIQQGTLAGTTYQKLSYVFTAVAGKTYRITLFQVGGSGGEVLYWDDILVQEIQAKDASGNGNHGTLNGGTNTAGPTVGITSVRPGLGSGYEFDGTDDNITASSPAVTTGKLTLEAWLYTDVVNDGVTRVAYHVGDDSYYIGKNGTGFPLFSWKNASNVQITLAAAVAFTAGTWTHVIGVNDGTTAYIYVNGVLSNSAAATLNASIGSGATSAGWGGGNDFTSNRWDGRIDETRALKRAYGPEEVAMRYNATVQRLARWVPSASMKLEQTTDKMDGTYAIKATSSASNQDMTLTTVPMDLSAYTHFGVWTKTSPSGSVAIRIGSDSSNYRQYTLTTQTTYGYDVKVLSSPTSTTGSPNMARVTFIQFTGIASGISLFADSLKFMNMNEAGDWRYSLDSGASTGYTMKALTTPVVNDRPGIYTMDFPVIGKYYVGVMAGATGSGGFVECYVDGVASGTPKAVSTSGLATQQTQLMFGPFTIAAAGSKTVEVRVSTVGSMTSMVVDFLAVYPFEDSTGTPAASKYHFPKTLFEENLWISEAANDWGVHIGSRVGGTAVYGLDGVDDYIDVVGDTILRRANDFTYEIWTKPDVSLSAGFLLTYDNPGSDTTDSPEFKLLSDGRVRLERNNVGQEVNTSGRFQANLWNHFVVTFKDGVTVIYLDGQVDTTSSGITAFAIAAGLPLLIGRRGVAADQNFRGSMHKVRVYDRALTAAEVLARYNATVNGATPTADESAAGVYTQQTVTEIVGQEFKLIEGEKAIAQHIQARVLSILGERILHPTYGMNFPLLETIFDENLLRGEVARTILEDPDVEDIPQLDVTFDGRIRRATYEAQVKLKDGSLIGVIGTTG